MGLFSRRSSPARQAPSSAAFAQWIDPPVVEPTADWQRKLNAYARRCAAQLQEAQVPLWRSAYARQSVDTFQDAFWVISMDVERAERRYLVHAMPTLGRPSRSTQPSSHPPAAGPGQWYGRIQADALLLTRTGIVCCATAEMFPLPSGGVANNDMDSLFHAVHQNETLLKTSPWAWGNRGRWRRVGKTKIHGATFADNGAEFSSSYAPGAFDGKDPGRGASSALSSFVRTGGQIQWPRRFPEPDY